MRLSPAFLPFHVHYEVYMRDHLQSVVPLTSLNSHLLIPLKSSPRSNTQNPVMRAHLGDQAFSNQSGKDSKMELNICNQNEKCLYALQTSCRAEHTQSYSRATTRSEKRGGQKWHSKYHLQGLTMWHNAICLWMKRRSWEETPRSPTDRSPQRCCLRSSKSIRCSLNLLRMEAPQLPCVASPGTPHPF